ncbi:MoaD/ThiS family protein [uncultured Hyphomicrobium sp.]|uniref:MoaD/ThiS family protein n=1 Tax=uncultured Hyphomicrobium sp. TaxID=194373 RepID=UPI0025D2EBBA|nr:MoaD/ThiS family protein [uncultured Hyphomicrobium sp.]
MTRMDEARIENEGETTVSVLLPRALLDLFPEAVREVEVPARTVADVIGALEARWPGMRDRLCDSTPRVRRHINIFVDGERASLDTRLRNGVRVYVLTAISGG